MSIDISPSQVASYVAVGLTILLSSFLIKWNPGGIVGDSPMKKKACWPQHATLNIDVPPKTMWMNMGYWEVSQITAGDVALVALLMLAT